jgi:hypothetical protein
VLELLVSAGVVVAAGVAAAAAGVVFKVAPACSDVPACLTSEPLPHPKNSTETINTIIFFIILVILSDLVDHATGFMFYQTSDDRTTDQLFS